jgi:hypothetical protein
MSLFGPNIPKGITKQELPYLKGRLQAGKGTEKLHPKTLDHIMDMVAMGVDSDSYAERYHNIEQVSDEEARRIEEGLADELTPSQEAFVHRVFQEFVDKNKIPRIF